jgi:hypothetical protein
MAKKKKEERKGLTIKAKCKAEIQDFRVKKNQRADGKTAQVEIAIARSEKQAAKFLGEEFAKLAFGTLVQAEGEDGPEWVHLAKTITASQRFRLAKHVVMLEDRKAITKPSIQKILPVEKSDRVLVIVRLQVPTDQEVISWLPGIVGETIDVEFSPTQQDLPGIE